MNPINQVPGTTQGLIVNCGTRVCRRICRLIATILNRAEQEAVQPPTPLTLNKNRKKRLRLQAKALAQRTLNAASQNITQADTLHPPVPLPQIAVETDQARLEAYLQTWCNEKADAPEYANRLIAKETIENCFRESLSRLVLKSLELTSLPSFQGFSFLALENFDCGENQFIELPDFSPSMPALKEFWCVWGQLETLPNFSCVMPALEKVWCSTNRLRNLPDFSRVMPALKLFTCAQNNLETLPNFKHVMPALEEFYCETNQLKTLLDFSRVMPVLKIFNCSENQLNTFPIFRSTLSKLESFECIDNQIKTLPNLSRVMPALKGFNWTRNHLTTLPDLSLLMPPTLEWFNCLGNQLTALPNFSRVMPALKTFLCSENQLVTLPEAMLRWSRECAISVENNRFSPAYITTLQTSLERIRASHPTLGPQISFSIYDAASEMAAGILLDQTITFWLEKFKVAFPKTSCEALWSTLDESEFPNSTASGSMASGAAAGASSGVAGGSFLSAYQVLLGYEKQEALNQFLHKLTKTADYKNAGSQNNVIFKVQRFLSGALHNESFREHMFLLIDEALSSCGDRVSFYLGKIEIQWNLECKGSKLNQLGLAQLLIGVKRIELLDREASQIVTQHRLGDAIETFLYCQVQLKDALKLPLSIEGMLYPSMSGVTPTMLESAKVAVLAQTTSKEVLCALLAESDYWIQRLKKDTAANFKAINEKCSNALEALDTEMLGAAYQAETDRITAEQKRCEQSLVLSLTEDWLEKHYRKLSL